MSKKPQKTEPKIVIFDLETLPNLSAALNHWPELSNYPGLTLKATVTSIICAGYKIYGQKAVKCINAWDCKTRWAKDVNDDYYICKKIYGVLKDADAVITHNGKRFDWKYLQTRLYINGFKPLPDIPHIDTVQIARKNLLSFNNRLGTLSKWLVGDKKFENGGWKLWVNVYRKKKHAMKTMEKYCKQDVLLLEKVFEKLKPLIKNLPNRNLWLDTDEEGAPIRVCPNCGSEKIYFWGWRHTKTNSYRRLRCESCGSYARLSAYNTKPRSI